MAWVAGMGVQNEQKGNEHAALGSSDINTRLEEVPRSVL